MSLRALSPLERIRDGRWRRSATFASSGAERPHLLPGGKHPVRLGWMQGETTKYCFFIFFAIVVHWVQVTWLTPESCSNCVRCAWFDLFIEIFLKNMIELFALNVSVRWWKRNLFPQWWDLALWHGEWSLVRYLSVHPACYLFDQGMAFPEYRFFANSIHVVYFTWCGCSCFKKTSCSV